MTPSKGGEAKRPATRFSITEALSSKAEEEKTKATKEVENLPTKHFTQTDIDSHWKEFLEKLQEKDKITFNAVSGFRLQKTDENTITVQYASETSKSEFDKVQADFLNHFRFSVHHHKVELNFVRNKSLKREVITRRTLFDKMAQENPALRELDQAFKLDLN